MKDLPFTVYDFFAYLASGFTLIVICAYAFDFASIMASEMTVVVSLVWVIAAYVSGHVVAHMSAVVLETTLTRRWLRHSEATLFEEQHGWRAELFRAFLTPLPPETRQRVLRRAQLSEISSPGKGLFYHCFAHVKHDAAGFGRMSIFLNLYGFCRNVAMSCLLGNIALATGAALPFLQGGAPDYKLQWMIAPITGVAVVMIYRYLKFYRLYAVEMYITYAEGALAK